MKHALFTLSLILFTFQLASTQDVEQVKDTNGNPIFPSGRFYIKPSIFGAAGGGLKLGEKNNSICPLIVLQDYSEVINGLSVQFEIPGISPGIIFTNTTQLNIVFEEKPECVESSKWVVVDDDDDFPRSWIGIGGVEEHHDILDGLFNIQKHGIGYKLVFCPTFTAPQGVCHDIGRFDDENGRRLILTDDDPFEVVFVDVDATTESSI